MEANAEQVETRSGTLGQTIEQRKIIELPLNGRNAAALIFLTPGTADLNASNARGAGDTCPDLPLSRRPFGHIERLARRWRELSTRRRQQSRSVPQREQSRRPNPDALEEFSVQTNSFSAEHGNATGAVVNIVTKAGTNAFHGSAFDFLRNGALNARNFFAARHDQIKRNQFGGTFGGPDRKRPACSSSAVIREWFCATSAAPARPWFQQRRSAAEISRICFRERNWSTPMTRQPFPGNIIPIEPAESHHSEAVCRTARAHGRRRPCAVRAPGPPVRKPGAWPCRLSDSTSHRIYGRYFLARYPIDPVMTTCRTTFIRTQIGYLYFNQGFSGSDTWTIAPNVLNSFSASYNRNHTDLVSGSTFSVAELGANVAAPTDVKELRFGVTGYFTIQSSRPAQVYRNSLQFSDSLHWIRDRHQVYFGGELLRMNVKNYNPAAPGRILHLYPQRNSRFGRRHGRLLPRQPRPSAARRWRVRDPAVLVAQPFCSGQYSRYPQPDTQPRPALGPVHSAIGGERKNAVLRARRAVAAISERACRLHLCR